jgi:hypothetical protein
VDIVLGVSMTPTTVRMVLVEGEQADGLTMDHDVFDITAVAPSATSSASDQVIAAILGTQESAVASGHRLVTTGVTWSDYAEAAVLREALAARGIEDVALVSELHAAGALAQAVGRAVGYETTALMFIERGTATLSVVETADGSIVKVVSRSLHSADAMAVLTEMVTSLEARKSRAQGMFVVGSGVDVTSVKAHLEQVVSLPVISPGEPELALARGAALASASAPRFDASTAGLAYSQDPDGMTAGAAAPLGLAGVADQPAGVSSVVTDTADSTENCGHAPEGGKPSLLVASSLTAIFVVGIVTLVISLAVSSRPTVDQRPSTGENAVVPSAAAPAPPAAQSTPPVPTAPAVQDAQPAPALRLREAQTIEVAPPPAPAVTPPATQPAPFICRHLPSVCRLASRR